jgi:hypothetical protein
MKSDFSRYKNGIGLEIKQFVAFYVKKVSKKNKYSTTGIKFLSLGERLEAKQREPNTLKYA